MAVGTVDVWVGGSLASAIVVWLGGSRSSRDCRYSLGPLRMPRDARRARLWGTRSRLKSAPDISI
jgi:hypothetical protein